jgi:hypothetical protein
MERFSVNNLNEGKLMNCVRLQTKTSFQLWKNLENNGDTDRTWDTIRENIRILAKESIGHCESKHYKPWSVEEGTKVCEIVGSHGIEYEDESVMGYSAV